MICKAFQPICGTLKPFDESNRPTVPGIKPRPFTDSQVHLSVQYFNKCVNKKVDWSCSEQDSKISVKSETVVSRCQKSLLKITKATDSNK